MTSPTPATPADNILTLNTLKSSVPTILSSAGHAFSALTNAPLPTPPAPDQTPLDAHKAVFRENTTTFFTLVKQLGDTLKEQAAALEEAGIIPAEAPRFGVSDGASAAGEVTNGGLGDLDVGWLNSRRDEVGKRKYMELMKEVRRELEAMVEGEKGRDEDMKEAA